MENPVRLLPESRREFHDAAAWYDQRQAGLGTQFVGRVRTTLDRISADPQRHAAIYLDVAETGITPEKESKSGKSHI